MWESRSNGTEVSKGKGIHPLSRLRPFSWHKEFASQRPQRRICHTNRSSTVSTAGAGTIPFQLLMSRLGSKNNGRVRHEGLGGGNTGSGFSLNSIFSGDRDPQCERLFRSGHAVTLKFARVFKPVTESGTPILPSSRLCGASNFNAGSDEG